MNLHLNFCKRYDVHFDSAAAEAQFPGQIQYFFLGSVRSIGITVKMNRIDLNSAFRNHPPGHRTVDPP